MLHTKLKFLLTACFLLAGLVLPLVRASAQTSGAPQHSDTTGLSLELPPQPQLIPAKAEQQNLPKTFAPQPVGKQPQGRRSVKDSLPPALFHQALHGPSDSPHAWQAEQRPSPVFRGNAAPPLQRRAGKLTHVVHGYHPYWISDDAADSYRWDLLTHLAYFSYEVDAATGEPLTVHAWRTSTVIDRAKAAGVKVLLTVTNFGDANNRTLLSSPQARDVLITRLIALLQERGGNGVNIDFESMPGDQRVNLVSFFAELRSRLDAAIPDAVISVAAPAVDWNNAWDVASLSSSIDLFFVMCYDYSWSSSTAAGPVAPIRGMSYNVERSLRWYLDQGVPPSRLVMGVPYYGYDWPVVSEVSGAATTGRATARTYSAVASMLPTNNRQWSDSFLNPWIAYNSGGWQQLWYDDDESLEYKYQLVKDLAIAGIGMWALGYDADLPELWNLIERMFTRTTAIDALPAPAAFNVWPHPLRAGQPGLLSLSISSAQQQTGASAVIYDLLGRMIAQPAATILSDGLVRILVPDIPAGVYLLVTGGVSRRILVSNQ
ncbi:MAG: glycosyl hydrolase family 18 protein [Bacteroidota bacterium]